MSKDDLSIEKGSRHCKIIDGDGEVVFRTTNLRDANHYLDLRAENQRLLKLLESRGMAPHRIYLLAADEKHRGRANIENAPAREVVIVAKADDAVVVRDLNNGKEEIVDLEEIEPIEGGSYLQATEVSDETLNVVVRYDKEVESAYVAVFQDPSIAEDVVGAWSSEETPDEEYAAVIKVQNGETVLFRAESLVNN